MAAVVCLLTKLRPSQKPTTDRNPPYHSTAESFAPQAPDQSQDRNCQKSISHLLDTTSGHRAREEEIKDSLAFQHMQ